jgi:hypothetical protein
MSVLNDFASSSLIDISFRRAANAGGALDRSWTTSLTLLDDEISNA